MRDNWAVEMAEEILSERIRLKVDWNYNNGVVFKALLSLYNSTGDKKYFDFVKKNIDICLNDDGTIKEIDYNKHNLDNYNNGKILIELFKETKEKKYKLIIDNLYKVLQESPRTQLGSFWQKDTYNGQIWADGVYMAVPFYAQCIDLIEERKSYNDVLRQFLVSYKCLKDKNTGLVYHGFDETKSNYWSDKITGQSRNFWSRAIGWYCMALIDTMKVMTDKVYDIKYLKDISRNLAEAIIKFQDNSGCWFQIIDCADRKGNYLEASSSCMFLYFLIGIYKLGILRNDLCKEAIRNAYNGIIDEFILITDEGKINLNKNCGGAGLGGKYRRDGSFAYYIGERIVTNDLRGVGAFMLAMNEYNSIKL